ncbi:cell wall-associated NlpC family hydrolase [Paenibacillus cellulosilyticus]|uniref:Cell wall-associated NlpC family hydrolase n=1 Tax=Paenibacillus cellulosilyticus TaxID=375489 RepID=A0A2V2YNN2_9BACL|nr:C40 family peptidase [Paenibacillus cellulosilyticus]PWV97337.1 cell wall-associated NlpC family hydrolase [Paenibacillus cellulosilyticus]QKS47463.1 C40 family peptidase [Paenibacillus cellulosilyticus]
MLTTSWKKPLLTASMATMLAFGSLLVPAADVFAAQIGTATVQSGVNMRTSPSTSGSIIRMVKKGENLVVLEKTNSYWYKVQDSSGQIGYVSTSSQYLNVTLSSSSNGSTSTSTGTNATIVKSVNFRTGASTSASSMGYLSANEKVTIISVPNSYWYQIVDSKGRTGYVSSQSQYITVTGSLPSSGGSSTSTGSSSSSGSTSSGSSSGSTTETDASRAALIEKVIATGMKYLGTPYEYGSDRNTTTTFDCSDLFRQMYLEGIGLKLPADSRGQGEYVKSKGNAVYDWHQLKRGDILVFMDYKGSKASDYAGIDKSTQRISHDAIYLGDGKILHTYSKESGGVKITSIEGTHWEYRFIYGGSVI